MHELSIVIISSPEYLVQVLPFFLKFLQCFARLMRALIAFATHAPRFSSLTTDEKPHANYLLTLASVDCRDESVLNGKVRRVVCVLHAACIITGTGMPLIITLRVTVDLRPSMQISNRGIARVSLENGEQLLGRKYGLKRACIPDVTGVHEA